VYPAAALGRHLVVIGASGSGKTETVLRLAAGARRAYGWRVYYLDCKGDEATAERFETLMGQAGCQAQRCFPSARYDGWRGNPVALLNRLLAVVDYTEPYYRDIARAALDLALRAPGGPPRSAADLLARLDLETLADRYQGRPEMATLRTIGKDDMHGVSLRYRAFLQAVDGALDGEWAFGDVDAGYLLLRGLELKDQTGALGRYLLEDFAHYVAGRKADDDRVLLIVDEFPAIAFGGAQAATLFELVRSRGASVIVTAQSYAGLGNGAERMLGAAAGVLLHQCGDPEELLQRAGMATTYQRRVAYAQRGVTAGSAHEYELGEGAITSQPSLKVDPNWVRTQPTGVCVLIAEGRYQQVCVRRAPGIAVPAPHAQPMPIAIPIVRGSRVGNALAPSVVAQSEIQPRIGTSDDTPEV
jgi:hypothetical protein